MGWRLNRLLDLWLWDELTLRLVLLNLSRIERSVLNRLLHLRHHWSLNWHGSSLLLWWLRLALNGFLTRLRSQNLGLLSLRSRLLDNFSRVSIAEVRVHAIIQTVLLSRLQLNWLFLWPLLLLAMLGLRLHL